MYNDKRQQRRVGEAPSLHPNCENAEKYVQQGEYVILALRVSSQVDSELGAGSEEN